MFETFSFLEYLILLLIVLLFAKEDLMPWIKSKLGIKTDNNPATKGEFSKLSDHVNHRQTEILEAQTRILEKVELTVGSIVSGLKDIHIKHAEWEKYGVPTRCKDKEK